MGRRLNWMDSWRHIMRREGDFICPVLPSAFQESPITADRKNKTCRLTPYLNLTSSLFCRHVASHVLHLVLASFAASVSFVASVFTSLGPVPEPPPPPFFFFFSFVSRPIPPAFVEFSLPFINKSSRGMMGERAVGIGTRFDIGEKNRGVIDECICAIVAKTGFSHLSWLLVGCRDDRWMVSPVLSCWPSSNALSSLSRT